MDMRPDASEVFQFLLKTLLGLGVFTLLFHYVSKTVRSIKKYAGIRSQNDAEQAQSEAQTESRENAQRQFDEKASDYSERILQPRLEAKQKRKDDEFHRFMGPQWKGARHRLGGGDAPGEVSNIPDVRHLPEPQLNNIFPQNRPKVKKVIDLPEEPPEGTEGVVTVVLRTPQGRNHKRRFLQTHTVQVLLDLMTKVGYHEKLHQLVSSYPRQVVSSQPHHTLQQAGITHDMALNVEEIMDEE